MRKLVVRFAVAVCVFSVRALAQNKVVFNNRSGEPALVKLIGPTPTELEVPDGAKVGVDAAAGRYFIKVRYGNEGRYQYVRGQEFEVKGAVAAKPDTTINLQKVVAGDYESAVISAEDFGKPGEQANPPSTQAGNVPQSPSSDLAKEREVYSFLVKNENAAAIIGGGPEDARECFVVSQAVQEAGVTAVQLTEKFGDPTVTEPNVRYSTPSSTVPDFHKGDLWFYGRVGVLIEDGKAVAVVRRVRLKGTDTESVRRSWLECFGIGKPSEK